MTGRGLIRGIRPGRLITLRPCAERGRSVFGDV